MTTMVHHRFGIHTVAITLEQRKKLLSHDFRKKTEYGVDSVTNVYETIYTCIECNYLIAVRIKNRHCIIMFYKHSTDRKTSTHIPLMFCNEAKLRDLL